MDHAKRGRVGKPRDVAEETRRTESHVQVVSTASDVIRGEAEPGSLKHRSAVGDLRKREVRREWP